MSDPLSFGDHVLARAQLMLRLGRPTAARGLLNRLVRHPEQSHRIRADAHRLLAGIAAEAALFRRARRHLVAAIQLRRHADELYVEYARAVAADPDADPRLAVKAMRRAVGLDPFEPRSWAALGTAARNAGDPVLARKSFRRAARLGPDDTETLSELVTGLVDLGFEEDARRVLTAARFRLAGRADVAALADRLGFDLAARRQRLANRNGESPRLLPFPLRGAEDRPAAGAAGILRVDRPSAPRPHLIRLFGRHPGPRQAN